MLCRHPRPWRGLSGTSGTLVASLRRTSLLKACVHRAVTRARPDVTHASRPSSRTGIRPAVARQLVGLGGQV
ncbi:hypothetical protein OBBRIDRAFT_795208 [Obba rivulosa]|uniref:Uncharacterized protein n=1 Tax=Obba rivulosa TaxID=1052685 RepID=A0A8E2AZT6_9APHY|nr:hypothetical protein OBBRIDRAFT_795208 [Obba rivulosa]